MAPGIRDSASEHDVVRHDVPTGFDATFSKEPVPAGHDIGDACRILGLVRTRKCWAGYVVVPRIG